MGGWLGAAFKWIASTALSVVRWIWENPVKTLVVSAGLEVVSWLVQPWSQGAADILHSSAEYLLYGALVSYGFGWLKVNLGKPPSVPGIEEYIRKVLGTVGIV